MALQETVARCIEQTLNGSELPKTGKIQLLVEMNFKEGSLGTVVIDRYYDKFSFSGKEVQHEVTAR